MLILVGVLFLLRNLGVIDFEMFQVFMYWPMILVAIGIVQLIDRSYVSGFILLFLGSVFMLPRLEVIQYGAMRVFWPVALIVIGGALIFRRRGVSPSARHYRTDPTTDAKRVSKQPVPPSTQTALFVSTRCSAAPRPSSPTPSSAEPC